MHMRKKNNLICILLAIAIVFSGMCSDKIQTDSLFSYANQTASTSTICSYDSLIPYTVIRTEELTGARQIANTFKRHSERLNDKSGSRPGLYAAFPAAILPEYLFFISCVTDMPIQEIVSNSIIITYIHNKDGKKSPNLF